MFGWDELRSWGSFALAVGAIVYAHGSPVVRNPMTLKSLRLKSALRTIVAEVAR